MSIAERQAAFAADLGFEDLPGEVVDYAKRLLLDTAGIAIGAERRAASSRAFFEGVRTLDAGSGGTVLATGESMAPEYAALLNGAMAHSLDFDDTHRASSLHPGAPVLPAALAAAERVDASGADLLTGLVVGYEVTVRLGMAVVRFGVDGRRGERRGPRRRDHRAGAGDQREPGRRLAPVPGKRRVEQATPPRPRGLAGGARE